MRRTPASTDIAGSRAALPVPIRILARDQIGVGRAGRPRPRHRSTRMSTWLAAAKALALARPARKVFTIADRHRGGILRHAFLGEAVVAGKYQQHGVVAARRLRMPRSCRAVRRGPRFARASPAAWPCRRCAHASGLPDRDRAARWRAAANEAGIWSASGSFLLAYLTQQPRIRSTRVDPWASRLTPASPAVSVIRDGPPAWEVKREAGASSLNAGAAPATVSDEPQAGATGKFPGRRLMATTREPGDLPSRTVLWRRRRGGVHRTGASLTANSRRRDPTKLVA